MQNYTFVKKKEAKTVRVHEKMKQNHWLPTRQLGEAEMYSCKQTFIPHTLLCMEVRITGFKKGNR